MFSVEFENISNTFCISWFQKRIFSDRHVSLSHYAFNNAGTFSPLENDDTDDAELLDDRKIDENSNDKSTNDNTDNCKNNVDCKTDFNRVLAASITYKDEDIIRAIGDHALR